MASPRRATAVRTNERKQASESRRAAPKRGQTAEAAPGRQAAKSDGTGGELTDAERQVLGAFRKFLMVPGEMLCFASNDLASMKDSLRRLTDAGMLVAEKFPGAYSLTTAGFARMGAAS